MYIQQPPREPFSHFFLFRRRSGGRSAEDLRAGLECYYRRNSFKAADRRLGQRLLCGQSPGAGFQQVIRLRGAAEKGYRSPAASSGRDLGLTFGEFSSRRAISVRSASLYYRYMGRTFKLNYRPWVSSIAGRSPDQRDSAVLCSSTVRLFRFRGGSWRALLRFSRRLIYIYWQLGTCFYEMAISISPKACRMDANSSSTVCRSRSAAMITLESRISPRRGDSMAGCAL